MTICFLAVTSACNGAPTVQYDLKSGAAISAVDPLSLSSAVLNLDASQSSTLTSTSSQNVADTNASAVLSWSDSFSAGSSWLSNGSGFITRVLDAYSWISIPQGMALNGPGRLPDDLGTQFTFFIVTSSLPDGSTLRFGVDDQTEALLLTTTSGKISLTHGSLPGVYLSRTYSNAAISQNSVLAAVFGAADKDLNLYINGVRLTDFVESSAGSATTYQTLARDFKLSLANGSAGALRAGRLLMMSDKLSPQPVYAVSKYLGSKWGITVPSQVSSEVVNDTMPMVEPDQINSEYIYQSILAPKCLSCHQPGGTTNIYFQSYSLLTTGSGPNGRFVVPGDLASSRLYQAVLSNQMPAGGATPLSTNEKSLIQQWITAGAPQ